MKLRNSSNTYEMGFEQDDAKSKFLHLFNLYFPHLQLPEVSIQEVKEGCVAKLLLFGVMVETNKIHPEPSDATNHIYDIGHKTVSAMVDTIKSIQKTKDKEKKGGVSADKGSLGGRDGSSISQNDHLQAVSNVSPTCSKDLHGCRPKKRTLPPEHTIWKHGSACVCNPKLFEKLFGPRCSSDKKDTYKSTCNHPQQNASKGTSRQHCIVDEDILGSGRLSERWSNFGEIFSDNRGKH